MKKQGKPEIFSNKYKTIIGVAPRKYRQLNDNQIAKHFRLHLSIDKFIPFKESLLHGQPKPYICLAHVSVSDK